MTRKSYRQWEEHSDEVVEETRKSFKNRDNKRYDKSKRRIQDAKRKRRAAKNGYFEGT